VVRTQCVGLLMAWGLAGPLAAKDLGTIGPVHAIAEQDMLLLIEQRLQAKAASGELARLQQAAMERAKRSIREPKPVDGLARSTQRRTQWFDPSVHFDEPVLDEQGRVLVAAGTQFNPLTVLSFGKTWLFFDGRDAAQVRRAKAFMDSATGPVKPILVGGSPLALAERWKRRVYFDQGGRLTQRLGLKAVPAAVTQEGSLLRIEELGL
jgi:conjugal transfer pilus assembly protein TraW